MDGVYDLDIRKFINVLYFVDGIKFGEFKFYFGFINGMGWFYKINIVNNEVFL